MRYEWTKKINDDEGHLAGDKAIITFSTALCDAKKRGFIVYRIGGDEFMVVGLRQNQEETMAYIKRAQAILEKTEYSASFGFAMYKPGDDIEEIQKRADDKMYKNKRFIKNQIANEALAKSSAISNTDSDK